jgi:cytokinin riboside 5'-monophosphate phosphoribohydrolase
MTPQRRRICVYCSASDAVSEAYISIARDFGKTIATRGFDLVYGGGRAGMMGPLAEQVQAHGGKVLSIIPKWSRERPIWYDASDEVTLCNDLRHRKELFESNASAFVALPGGFGTLDEMLDITVLKHLGRHDNPLVYLNHNHFFDNLKSFYNQIFEQKFADEVYRELHHFAATPIEVIDFIENFKGSSSRGKWGMRG